MNIILPSYTTKLPSTGKTVSYRPFTVREEKALLLALQENNLETVANAIKNTVRICTDNQVDPDISPYYDIEFLFLEIRSKSVGEIIELIGSCDCSPSAKTDFSIDIANKKVEPSPTQNNTIKIVDTPYTIIIRHPTMSDFIESFMGDVESGSNTVASCIQSVFSEDEVFNWDFTEKLNFVESMTPKQQKGIAEFLEVMPMVKMDASYRCKACGKDHVQELSGFENFFV